MAGFSNFELECNLQAKSNELGNFLIDTTENYSFNKKSSISGAAADFVPTTIAPAMSYSHEYNPSYSNYNIDVNQSSENYNININQSSAVYPRVNTSLYYPSTIEHQNPKNYAALSMQMQPVSGIGSIYNQHEIYAHKFNHQNHHYHLIHNHYQQLSNLSNTSNSNAALLTAQVPRTVKEFGHHYQHKKHFQNDKKIIKLNRYNVVKDKPRDLSPIVVSLEKLRIGPDYPNPSELFTILSLFRQLSHYTMQMCKERRSLETLFLCNVTGYIPDSNYLPAVIKDISSHIKLTKQAISHEFYEIQKLIGSIKICQYGNINELNDNFQLEILNLEKYEYIHIRHKNGMLLLSNDKIVGLKNILINLIEYVRLYTVYVTTLKYKITKERNIAVTAACPVKALRSNGRQELRRIGV